MDEYAYARQWGEWARVRLAALDAMEEKLQEMKALAELARDYSLDVRQIERLNFRVGILQAEVSGLDHETREFYFIDDFQ